MKDIYVEFKSGDIKGETKDEIFSKKFALEISSFSHVVRQPKSATASTAGGHTAERTEHGEIVLTKDIDKATTKLLLACSAGTIYKDVIIYFNRAVGGNDSTKSTNSRSEYYKIELRNVLVSHVSTNIGEEGIPTETFGLKYAAIQWTYVQPRIDGSGNEGAITTAWNLSTNQPKFA